MVAMSQLRSFGHLLREGQVHGAVATARSCLETSARVTWLVDPDESRQVRFARSMAERADQLRWRHRLDVSGPDVRDDREDLEQQLNEMKADLDQLKICYDLHGKGLGPTRVAGEQRPKWTELVPTHLSRVALRNDVWPDIYRMLAAASHGDAVAVRQFTNLGTDEEENVSGSEHFLYRQGVMLTLAVVLAVTETLHSLASYSGWGAQANQRAIQQCRAQALSAWMWLDPNQARRHGIPMPRREEDSGPVE